MFKITQVITAGFLVLLTGCAATAPNPQEMRAIVNSFVPPRLPDAGRAMIYVVRPSVFGGLIRFNVFVDNQEDASEMGYTRGSQYIYFSVLPGQHHVFSKAENWADIYVTAKAGDVLYIRQDPQLGIVMAENSLYAMQDYEGKYYVKTSGLGTILRTDATSRGVPEGMTDPAPSNPTPAVALVASPDAQVRASGLLARPRTALHLSGDMVLNKTWIYPHPLDVATYGNVELTFTSAGLSANSNRGRSTGSYDVKDDQLCISLAASGTTCYFLVQEAGQTKLFFSKSGIKSSLVVRDVARPPDTTPGATAHAATVEDRVPFLSDKRQAEYQQKFLSLPLPRACAISDNGHFAYVSGTRPKDPTLPREPTARALQLCAAVAGKACVLYAVDNDVVYQPVPDVHAVSP
jgi:hypothetical protein